MRLWLYEREIDEGALLQDAASANVRDAQAAKKVLSMLWRQKRISLASTKELIVRYLNPYLKELPSTAKGRHEVMIATDPAFPFPQNSWVQNRSTWEIGNDTIKFDGGWGVISLSNAAELGGFSGPAADGSSARVLLELREVDNKHNVLGSYRWSLGPNQLR
jgi:hypothetical protein